MGTIGDLREEDHSSTPRRAVRVESDLGLEPIKAKIAEAEKARVHTMLVIGGCDVSLRLPLLV